MVSLEGYARRVARGSIIYLTALIAAQFVAFLLFLLLARDLGAEGYGLLYAVIGLFSYLSFFRDFGLNTALAKYIPEFTVKREYGKIRSSIVFVLLFQAIFAIGIVAVLFIFSGQLATAYFKTQDAVTPLKILSMWYFVTVFFMLVKGIFQGFQNMLAFSAMEFFTIFLPFVLAVLFVGAFSLGVSGAALAYFLGLSIAMAGSIFFLIRGYPQIFREKSSIAKPLAKKLLKFAIPVFIGGLGLVIVSYTDIVLITVFYSTKMVGFYGVASQMAHFSWLFAAAIGTVFLPMIAELWEKREKKILGSAIHFLIKIYSVLIIPVVLVFIAFPEIVINLLLGPGYLPAATTLQIISLVAIIYVMYTIPSTVLNGIGKPVIAAKVIGVMACFNLFGNLILIPTYGIEGAATVSLLSYIIGAILMLYFTRKFVRYVLPYLSILKALIGGGLTLLMIFVLKSMLSLPPLLKTVIVLIPSLLFYAGWALSTRAITMGDLSILKKSLFR
jgi:stage V sporulation protein B